MAETPLAKKLGIRPSFSLLILNAPEGYDKLLGALPDGVQIASGGSGLFDFVQIFVRDLAELRATSQHAIAATKSGGLLWITYPKQTSKIKTDINRDTTWQAMDGTGWRPVTQIAIDATWSALRFRPESDVKSKQK